jgi:hypothetical protein
MSERGHNPIAIICTVFMDTLSSDYNFLNSCDPLLLILGKGRGKDSVANVDLLMSLC